VSRQPEFPQFKIWSTYSQTYVPVLATWDALALRLAGRDGMASELISEA
jgi:hypothetical protein